MKNMKTISGGFPPFTIIFISILLISIFIPPSALAADVVDSGFVGYTNRATSINNVSVCTPSGGCGSSNMQSPYTIVFEQIENYGTGINQIHGYIPYSNVCVHASTDGNYNMSVRIRGGVDSSTTANTAPIVGNGSCYWSKSDDTSMYYLSLYIDDLDGLGAASGDYFFYIDGISWNGLTMQVYNGINWESPNPNWVCWGGWRSASWVRPAYTGTETRIVSLMSFQNAYYAYNNYALNINKTIGGTAYDSKIIVVDGNIGEIINESSFTDNDVWVVIQDPANGTTIHFQDVIGDTYIAYPSFTPLPPPDDGVLNVLSGTIVNAKTNAVIPSNDVNISTVTGYGGSYSTTSLGDGTYSISRIIDDIYTIEANRTGYEDYEYQKNITTDTPHIIYMTESITLDTNKSGVYGTITNYYNSVGVSDTWVKISNTTWSSVTYTNQNGYYEFLNFSPGNYTIQAQKTGYFPYESSLTFIPNVLKYYPIELVSEEVPADPTATPEPPVTNILTPFKSLIQQFGISEEFGGALIALFIIVFMGAIFTRAGPIGMIAAMFFGFVTTVFMGLLPSYLLSIVIIVVVLLVLYSRGDS